MLRIYLPGAKPSGKRNMDNMVLLIHALVGFVVSISSCMTGCKLHDWLGSCGNNGWSLAKWSVMVSVHLIHANAPTGSQLHDCIEEGYKDPRLFLLIVWIGCLLFYQVNK